MATATINEMGPAPEGRQPPRILTLEELRALVEASGPGDHLLVMTALDTGLRINEIANLRASSILNNQLLVDGKTGLRRVPVSAEIARGLIAIAQGGQVIWKNRRGEPMKTDAVGARIRRLFDHAGISGPGSGPHTLRRTFAAWFIRNGGNILALNPNPPKR